MGGITAGDWNSVGSVFEIKSVSVLVNDKGNYLSFNFRFQLSFVTVSVFNHNDCEFSCHPLLK